MKHVKENTIAQFFADTGFQPPKGHNSFDFGFGFDSGADADMKLDGYDGIPSNIADIRGDLNDASEMDEHPLASIYGDFYMFNDPGSRNNPDLRTPLGPEANHTNVEYHKKDLSRIDSASDVHLETLEQPAEEFPRHQQVHSQMEPSVLGAIDQSEVQPPQPGELVLETPHVLEGVKYPAGTRLLVEIAAEEAFTQDDLFERPDAKLCPLCYDPYVGDVCPRCKAGVPGPNAVRVKESIRQCPQCGSVLSPAEQEMEYCDACDASIKTINEDSSLDRVYRDTNASDNPDEWIQYHDDEEALKYANLDNKGFELHAADPVEKELHRIVKEFEFLLSDGVSEEDAIRQLSDKYGDDKVLAAMEGE